MGGVHRRGERRIAPASLVDHGGDDPDFGRRGGIRQAGFQAVEEGASALGGEAAQPGGGPETSWISFGGSRSAPRTSAPVPPTRYERRIVAAPVTGLAGAVEENLRSQARRAAQSEEAQVLGAFGNAGGADAVGVGARQEQGEGRVGGPR
ncbi:hypothetical protein ACFXA3_29520 [Streptomyces sp. NPDC059456]|uniref:hypothetical protein n=1 Tax=Streptomyces sp. NPDC059456 TaxID=3346838 RepID=UPI0036A9CE95